MFAFLEPGGGGAQVPLPPGPRRRVVDPIRRKPRDVVERVAAEQALFDHAVGGDQQRVAREGRVRAVGRVAVADRAHGQHLPPAQPGAVQPAGEGMRLRPGVARSVGAREGRRMKEDAARSLAQIEGHPALG